MSLGDELSIKGERGAFRFSSAAWIALVLGGIYFGIMLVPPYAEAYEVRQLLREATNQARQLTDDQLRLLVIEKAKRIGSHYEIQEGQEVLLPGIVILSDDIFINRDDIAKSIIIQVDYSVRVKYPFAKKQVELRFNPAVKGDLRPVVW